MREEWSLETRSVHLPGEREIDDGLVPPIHQISTFQLKSAADAAEKAASTHPERFYTRWGNPTVQILENAVAEMERGEKALASASGMGAISTTVLTLLEKKKHVVAGRPLYSATSELFTGVLSPYGVNCTFVDPTDPTNFGDATTSDTALYYVESPANPTLTLTDIRAVAETGEARGVPLIVDNTFATPYNQNPLELGARVVIHSATKYLGGHLDATGGILVADAEFFKKAWKTLETMGTSLSPFEAWLILRGLRTFHLRMKRHNSNAQEVAEFLERQPSVDRVYYPGLENSPQFVLARRQMRGYGGMISFEIAGGYDAGRRFVESIGLCRLAVSLGGVQTLVEHPSSMTHGTLSEEEKRMGGISEGLIRISVGIEHPTDIIADVSRALSSVG